MLLRICPTGTRIWDAHLHAAKRAHRSRANSAIQGVEGIALKKPDSQIRYVFALLPEANSVSMGKAAAAHLFSTIVGEVSTPIPLSIHTLAPGLRPGKGGIHLMAFMRCNAGRGKVLHCVTALPGNESNWAKNLTTIRGQQVQCAYYCMMMNSTYASYMSRRPISSLKSLKSVEVPHMSKCDPCTELSCAELGVAAGAHAAIKPHRK